jgi:hypothetical protein
MTEYEKYNKAFNKVANKRKPKPPTEPPAPAPEGTDTHLLYIIFIIFIGIGIIGRQQRCVKRKRGKATQAVKPLSSLIKEETATLVPSTVNSYL